MDLIVTLSIKCLQAECHYAECHALFSVMLNVVILNLVAPKFQIEFGFECFRTFSSLDQPMKI
jgi:hypothetical protein